MQVGHARHPSMGSGADRRWMSSIYRGAAHGPPPHARAALNRLPEFRTERQAIFLKDGDMALLGSGEANAGRAVDQPTAEMPTVSLKAKVAAPRGWAARSKLDQPYAVRFER